MGRVHFNPDTFMVIDRVTGEEINTVKFLLEATKEKWEKVYADKLSRCIGLSGNSYSKILAYIIISRDSNNLLHGTYREIAEKSNTNKSAVQRVFKVMERHELLKKVRSGCYMMSPKIIRDEIGRAHV